jgi:pimeloyl-ACP methyl ester carboxylesterase
MRCILAFVTFFVSMSAFAQESPKPHERPTASLLFRSILGLPTGNGNRPTAPLSAVKPSEMPAAKAYLLRGFYGVFSTGMDDIAKELQKEGIPSRVELHTAHDAMARAIIEEHRGSAQPPLIIVVGHSYGADDAVLLTRKLHEANVPVALLATIDPVAPHKVASNVNSVLNIYKSKKVLAFIPAWRGVALDAETDLGEDLRNIDIRDHPGLDGPQVTHSSIDDQPQIQQAVLEAIRKTVRPDR